MILLLLLLHTGNSITCPCDVTPGSCDPQCCCDVACTTQQITTFTCTPFYLSDTRLCCKDVLKLSDTGDYLSVRECSNKLGCLEDIPSSFTLYSNTTVPDSTEAQGLIKNNVISVDLTTTRTQYTDNDKIVSKTTDGTFQMFLVPVQISGYLCVGSPVPYYSEVRSQCRRDVGTDSCVPDSVLDYTKHIGSILSYPNSEALVLNLADKLTFHCLDLETNTRAGCSPASTVPTNSGGVCSNILSALEIRLTIGSEKMVITEVSVDVTLTSVSIGSRVSQSFSVTYEPGSSAAGVSGNFGYVHGSPLLSGRYQENKIVMNSYPGERALSLFKSEDCEKFYSEPLKFGINFYTGCKMKLSLSKQDSGSVTDFCKVLRNITNSVFGDNSGVVVGQTGESNTLDITQWVYLTPLPELTSATPSAELECDDVTHHVVYHVFYTEIGEEAGLQSVITGLSAQYSSQSVPLACSPSSCTATLLLSNSVRYHPSPTPYTTRYKILPRISAVLPTDFFYPLTGGGVVPPRGSLWVLVLGLGISWIRWL